MLSVPGAAKGRGQTPPKTDARDSSGSGNFLLEVKRIQTKEIITQLTLLNSTVAIGQAETTILKDSLQERKFWDVYNDFCELDISVPDVFKKTYIDHLIERIDESNLNDKDQNDLRWFLDPFWLSALDEFPKFPLSKIDKTTYAPIVIRTILLDRIKSKEVRDLGKKEEFSEMFRVNHGKDGKLPPFTDYIRRKLAPQFKIHRDDIEDEIDALIKELIENCKFVQTAFSGSTTAMKVIDEGVDIERVYNTKSTKNPTSFTRQLGFEKDLVRLTGDITDLTERHRELFSMLQFERAVDTLQLKKVAHAFGGGMVFFVTPSTKGSKLPSCVIKIGQVDEIFEEVEKTGEFGMYFGNHTPKVKQVVELPDYEPDELAAAVELELCGGMFGLPGFTKAPPVITFTSLCQKRFMPPTFEHHRSTGFADRQNTEKMAIIGRPMSIQDLNMLDYERTLAVVDSARTSLEDGTLFEIKKQKSLLAEVIVNQKSMDYEHKSLNVSQNEFHQSELIRSYNSYGSHVIEEGTVGPADGLKPTISFPSKKLTNASAVSSTDSHELNPTGQSFRNEQQGGSAPSSARRPKPPQEKSHSRAKFLIQSLFSSPRDHIKVRSDRKRRDKGVADMINVERMPSNTASLQPSLPSTTNSVSRQISPLSESANPKSRSKIRYSRRLNAWIAAKHGTTVNAVDEDREDNDDTAHIDLQSVIVEVIDRNLYSFTFKDLKGELVRNVEKMNLDNEYKISKLVKKAIVEREKLMELGNRTTCLKLEELDPGGDMRRRLLGEKRRHESLPDFFQKVANKVKKEFSSVPIVTGRSHGDLHGGNLLIDVHGATWLIDFALSVPNGKHALFDITKLLITTLSAYPLEYDTMDNDENHMGILLEVLASIPNNRCGLKERSQQYIWSAPLRFAWELTTTIRNACIKYEYNDDDTSPYPWIIALLSWFLRVTTYREPEMKHIRTMLYGAIAMGARILHGDDFDSAPEWMKEGNQSWMITKRMSHGSEIGFEDHITLEGLPRHLQRYQVQVATKESYIADPITRQQCQVMDLQISCRDLEEEAKKRGKRTHPSTLVNLMDTSFTSQHQSTRDYSETPIYPELRDALNMVLDLCLSQRTKCKSNRLVIFAESGMGKTLLSKQMVSQAAQMQLIASDSWSGYVDVETDNIGEEGFPSVKSIDPNNSSPKGFNYCQFGKHRSSVRAFREESRQISSEDVNRLCRVMVPICIPLIEFANLYRHDSKITEANPQTDFIAAWCRMTYGKSGLAYRVVQYARNIAINNNKETYLSHEDKMSQPYLLCIFDGLDETGDLWPQFLEFLTNFIRAEPRHIVILNCRPGEDKAKDMLLREHSFCQFQINPLPRLQSEMFCRRKLIAKHYAEDVIERIVRLICYSSEFKEMRTIPLILSLILHIHDSSIGSTINQGKALNLTLIYRYAVHLMLYQVTATKVANRDAEQFAALMEMHRCRFFLRYAAYLAHKEREYIFAMHDGMMGPQQNLQSQRKRTAPIFWSQLRIFANKEESLSGISNLIAHTSIGNLPLLTGDLDSFRFARHAYEELLCGEFFACILMEDQSLTYSLFGSELELLRDGNWIGSILHALMTLNPKNMREWIYTYIINNTEKVRGFGFRRSKSMATSRSGRNRLQEQSHMQYLLFEASKFGAQPIVEELLQAKCPPDLKDGKGCQALHHAARQGYNAVAETLLDFKALLKGEKACNDNLRTPIQEAIFHGHGDVYRVLTRNSRFRGFQTDKALRDYDSSLPPTSKILHEEQDFTLYDRSNTVGSALDVADDILELHLSKKKLSPLVVAASGGNIKIVRAILENIPIEKIDYRCPGPARASALCFASENGHSKIVKLLLEKRADCNIKYGPHDVPILFWPCFAGYVDVVKQLLEAQAHPNGGNYTYTGVDSMKELVRKKITVEDSDAEEVLNTRTHGIQPIKSPDSTPIIPSREIPSINFSGMGTSQSRIRESLTGFFNGKKTTSPDVSDDNQGRSQPEISSSGFGVSDQLTPLHAAAATGQTHIVAMLLRYKADPHVVYEPINIRPAHLASFYGSDSSLALLQSVEMGDDSIEDEKKIRRKVVSLDEIRHLHECAPELIYKDMKRFSMKMERLF